MRQIFFDETVLNIFNPSEVNLYSKVTSNVNSVSVEVGKEFVFECSTGRGNPQASFEWLLDGELHPPSPNETASVSCRILPRWDWSVKNF